MSSTKRKVALTSAFMVGIVALSLKAYESAQAEEGMDRVKGILSALGPEEAHIPENVKNVIYVVEGSAGSIPPSVEHFVASKMAALGRNAETEFSWQVRKWLWARFVGNRISEGDMLALYCHFLPFEKGIGLARSAQYHFRRHLAALSPTEIITLLAVGRSPGGYSPIDNPKAARRMHEILMARYREGSQT